MWHGKRAVAVVVVACGTLLVFAAVSKSLAIHEVRTIARRSDEIHYFVPVAMDNGVIRATESFVPVRDWFGFHRTEYTLAEPAIFGASWYFRRPRDGLPRGLVLLRRDLVRREWRDARVIWFNEAEMRRIIREGQVHLPDYDQMTSLPVEQVP